MDRNTFSQQTQKHRNQHKQPCDLSKTHSARPQRREAKEQRDWNWVGNLGDRRSSHRTCQPEHGRCRAGRAELEPPRPVTHPQEHPGTQVKGSPVQFCEQGATAQLHFQRFLSRAEESSLPLTADVWRRLPLQAERGRAADVRLGSVLSVCRGVEHKGLADQEGVPSSAYLLVGVCITQQGNCKPFTLHKPVQAIILCFK